MKIKLIDFGLKKKVTEKPYRAHDNDTGADCYLQEDVYLKPQETKVIPLGYGIELPDGYSAHLQVRSGKAKQGLHVAQSAIDAGYRGQIHAIITNLSNQTWHFEKGDRLCYLVVYPVVYPDFVWERGGERGEGAFGSTGE